MEVKVFDLITASSGWNQTLLDHSFCEEVCSAILNIPLPTVRHLEDKQFRFFSKNEKYSVKTRYRLALRLCDREAKGEIGGSSSGTQLFGKNFGIWRYQISLNIWPTILNLVQRYWFQLPVLVVGLRQRMLSMVSRDVNAVDGFGR